MYKVAPEQAIEKAKELQTKALALQDLGTTVQSEGVLETGKQRLSEHAQAKAEEKVEEKKVELGRDRVAE